MQGYKDPTFGAYGTPDIPPGWWAAAAQRCEFSRGRNHLRKTGTLLNVLCKLAAVREPTLQTRAKNNKKSHPCGLKFSEQCNTRKQNLEALVAQAVGVACDLDNACVNCQALDGKLSRCVRAPDMESCANCHWERQGARCSFKQAHDALNKNHNRKRTRDLISGDGDSDEQGSKRTKISPA